MPGRGPRLPAVVYPKTRTPEESQSQPLRPQAEKAAAMAVEAATLERVEAAAVEAGVVAAVAAAAAAVERAEAVAAEVSLLLDGPPGRGPHEYASQKGGFFGLTPWLRGKSPPLLLLEWCCHAGSRVHPIGDTLCSREEARALFVVKSSNCRIFGIYPEMGAFLDRGMDCFPYSMDTRVYRAGLYTRVSSASNRCARPRFFA
jgi:hypothetical protein